MTSLVTAARRLFCRHEFVERGSYKRGNWWSVLACEKCSKVKREKLLTMPTIRGRDTEPRTSELTVDELRKMLATQEEKLP